MINNSNFILPKNEYYVYGYFYENGIPFYIGIGKGNRIKQHLHKRKDKTKDSILFYNVLNKLIRDGIKFSYKKIRYNMSQVEAALVEEVLVKLIGRRDLGLGPLCNLTDGGEGHKNYKKSEELKQMISGWSKGKTISPEHKEAIRLANLGKRHSAETRRKISEAQKGISKPKKKESIPNYKRAAIRKFEDDIYRENFKNSVRKLHSKSVVQYTLEGDKIKVWDSQHDACDTLGGRPDRIIKVCQGLASKHNNYKWRFL